MTDAAQVRKDALVRQLHDLGKAYGTEVALTIVGTGRDTHVAVVEFHDPTVRDVGVAEATTQPDGTVVIDEVLLADEALEAVGHAILRALSKSVGPAM